MLSPRAIAALELQTRGRGRSLPFPFVLYFRALPELEGQPGLRAAWLPGPH